MDMEFVTVNDLYQEYPDFLIDVEREQALIAKHDLIVFQHPFYWYSAPALLKEWQDLVLEFGYAYGNGAQALRDKWLLSVTTTGGSENAYRHSGSNTYTMAELLQPFDQTARFCGMRYLPPFVIHNTLAPITEAEILRHVRDYRQLLMGLGQGRIQLHHLEGLDRINRDISGLLERSSSHA